MENIKGWKGARIDSFHNKNVGKLGEEIANIILLGKGFKTICRNFRTKYGEIDIIVKKGEEIVFVEVKTRLNKNYGYAAEAVNFRKQNKIIAVSNYYLKINGLIDCKVRYDIVEVYLKGKKIDINHMRNVFF